MAVCGNIRHVNQMVEVEGTDLNRCHLLDPRMLAHPRPPSDAQSTTPYLSISCTLRMYSERTTLLSLSIAKRNGSPPGTKKVQVPSEMKHHLIVTFPN
ncbi:hypothetical protein NMY22_g9210 [Coprinellus aureogranulatus]|nr:hypothetical protein NMY22_g9210 [Coprinellus aureogranulatus]